MAVLGSDSNNIVTNKRRNIKNTDMVNKTVDGETGLKSMSSVSDVYHKITSSKRFNAFNLCVVLPVLLFVFYLVIWASPRYESRTQMIVKQPDSMATLDPSMAILAGFSGGAGSADTELVKAYIHSNNMLSHLEEVLQVSTHYENSDYDVFSRLSASASIEDRLDYFKQRVNVEIDEKSQVISVMAQAFEADFAERLTTEIVSRAEWYINEIGHNLAKAQLAFVQQEHQVITQKLQNAKSKLLAFQRQHRLLDPEAEGLALQQITYGLEAQIAEQQAALRALRNSMSEDAPLVMQAKEQLDGLVIQLKSERQRLTRKTDDSLPATESSDSLGVSSILAKYSDYRIDMEYALQAYTSSQISLEKSRIEAYRQLKFLVVVETPTLPEEAKYPQVFYNIVLFMVVILMLFGIGKIILATVEELK